MSLLDEIIALAVDDKSSIATLLRKCLVLAHNLKNERLKAWAEMELNGYQTNDEVPEYRKTSAAAKGHFLGSFGAQLTNQPLPPAVLEKEHQHFAESIELRQPIVAYEGIDYKSRSVFEWPPDLTLVYQGAFYEGYNLAKAWQEVAGSVFIGLLDSVRTRILRFALELKEDLGSVGDNPAQLPKARVDQNVANYIFGGNNIITASATNFAQFGSIVVGKGDLAALAAALKALGVQDSDISDLKSALGQDASKTTPSLGQRTLAWLKGLGGKLGEAGTTIGVEVVKGKVKKWILQYLGLQLS